MKKRGSGGGETGVQVSLPIAFTRIDSSSEERKRAVEKAVLKEGNRRWPKETKRGHSRSLNDRYTGGRWREN